MCVGSCLTHRHRAPAGLSLPKPELLNRRGSNNAPTHPYSLQSTVYSLQSTVYSLAELAEKFIAKLEAKNSVTAASPIANHSTDAAAPSPKLTAATAKQDVSGRVQSTTQPRRHPASASRTAGSSSLLPAARDVGLLNALQSTTADAALAKSKSNSSPELQPPCWSA